MASGVDLAIVAGYLVILLLIGFFVSRKQDMEGYFVNNRKTKTLMLLTATISTSIGAGAIIGIVSVSYQSGIGMGIAFFTAILLGWLLVAFLAKKIKTFGDKKKALTLGDFYAERYSKHTRITVASILVVVTFIWMAVQFVAMGNMLSVLTGLNFKIALFVAAVVTITYVTFGGIRSDFYTDSIQFWIMLLVFIMLIPLGLSHIGGISALSSLPSSHFGLFTFAGPVVFFGAMLLGIVNALVGMEVWQRIYSATNEKTAKKSLLLAAAINPLFYLAATLLGLIAAVAFTGIHGDTALFKLMEITLPVGLLGIGMVSLLAVLMSSLDSSIVKLSAIIAKDFYKTLIKPAATTKEMLKLGRLVGFGAGIIALIIAYISPNIIQLAIYALTLSLVFAPTLLGGFFWKRATAKAAIWSIIIGFTTALILIPLFKEQAFVPAMATSAIIFVVLSYSTKHSTTENVELMKA